MVLLVVRLVEPTDEPTELVLELLQLPIHMDMVGISSINTVAISNRIVATNSRIPTVRLMVHLTTVAIHTHTDQHDVRFGELIVEPIGTDTDRSSS